jgi:hypothetical protein
LVFGALFSLNCLPSLYTLYFSKLIQGLNARRDLSVTT